VYLTNILSDGGQMRSTKGISLMETAIALAIMGVVAVAFLSGAGTSLKSASIASKQTTAESLVISEVEYVKTCAYQYSASEYPVDPDIDIPVGWSIPPPLVELVHATDDGIQKVTVTAEHNGREILSISTYKVDR